MGDEYKIDRFADAGEEPNKILVPIEGYEKKDVLPLNKAVESIKDLLHNIDAMIYTAVENSNEPSDNLRPDESAAIHLYTMEWSGSYDSLYSLLNRTLRSEQRNELKPWFSYLKLLLTALYKLPPLKKIVWRVICGNVSNEYKKKYKIWWGFSSCTESREVAEKFIRNCDERTIFKIECINGRSIESHSYFKDEEEILLMPGTYLTVLKNWTEAGNIHIIELQELEPPYQLITPPFTRQGTGENFNKLLSHN
ncbi:unnamed protein product [Rotaria sp. Silwood2]|nr:unnamed protein product [Rotaria sp. Silwood2]CAF4560533.1 unnamed protein product [Rotaria sp. Silwood2]